MGLVYFKLKIYFTESFLKGLKHLGEEYEKGFLFLFFSTMYTNINCL